jgi:Na+-transporting NADH:ubiquinone oxidoreductase subunit A
MSVIKIKKGLDLPIIGEPTNIVDAKTSKHVAILGNDYIGLKPTMLVAVGDNVKKGQLLFTDKKMEGVKYTSPASGKVIEINRGEKRVFLSMVIELDGNDEIVFNAYPKNELASLTVEQVKEQLIESGLWTSLRERPFSKVANPKIVPHSIFITAMDSNPLAPSMNILLEGNEDSFKNGMLVLSKLTEGNLYLCKDEGAQIPEVNDAKMKVQEFSGVHPKGLPGTHIHLLDPASRTKQVWYVGLQDVIAIGELFTTGKINVERIISFAGPSVKNPRHIKTRIGASLKELSESELIGVNNRIISGSVLSGRNANKPEDFLGRYHQQVTVISENDKRDFLGWVIPKSDLFSVKNVLLSSLMSGKKFSFNTALNGGERAIVPVGSYEKVMPLDILPTFLLRSLAVDDVEEAEALGCMELDEEDLALCTFVCPSKIDHGLNLRRNLTLIDKEG